VTTVGALDSALTAKSWRCISQHIVARPYPPFQPVLDSDEKIPAPGPDSIFRRHHQLTPSNFNMEGPEIEHCIPTQPLPMNLRYLLHVMGLLIALFLPHSVSSQVYWDTNGSAPGSSDGTTASGTWDNTTTANWNLNYNTGSTASAGTDNLFVTWQSSAQYQSSAIFSAGSNATGTSEITVVGTVEVENPLLFEEGIVVFSGGAIELTSNLSTIEVMSGASAIINSTLSTSTGLLRKTGGGNLTVTSFNDSVSNIYSNGGTLEFSGSGVALTNDFEIIIGQTADGNISILDGASVTLESTGTAQIGFDPGVTGILSVDGTGSNFQTGNISLDVGLDGTGNLNVTDGATVTTNGIARFGVNASGVGHGLVSGTGTTLTSQGYLQLGTLGTGDLTIDSGGKVVANDGLVFGSAGGGSGVLNLNTGGTLETATISIIAGGAGTFNLAGGTITATGASLNNGVAMSLTNNSTVDTNGRNAYFTGILSGAGSLTKTGAGTLVLSAENTYEGGTTISAGSLQIGHDSTTGSVAGDITNNANLQFSRSDNITYGGVISGTGTLTKTGAGNLTLSSANTFSGATTISAGTVTLGHVNALQGSTLTTATGLSFGSLELATLGGLSGSQNLALTNGSAAAVALTVGANNADTSYSGILSGSGSLTKSGSGTLTLSADNTYAGGTTISAGTLSGNTTSLQGNITNNAVVVFDQASTGTYASIVSGTGSLTKTGSGSLTLSGTNDYSGGTTVIAGTLVVSSDAKLGAISGALAVSNGATLNTGGDFRTNRAVTVDGTNTSLGNNGELIIGNTGSGSLALTNGAAVSAYNLTVGYDTGGSGTLDIASGSTVTASNGTYVGSAGGTGTLNLNTGGTLTTPVLSGSGTFNLAGGTLRSGAALSSSLAATLSNTSTVDTNGFATTLSGNLSGSGSLTKSGAGDLTLSGTNDYSGGTTVNAGSLSFATQANLGTGDLSIANGATVNISGGYQDLTNRTVTIDGTGSTLAGAAHLWFNRATGSTQVIDVTNGGSLTAGTTFSLGDLESTSVGTLNVSGTDSLASSGGIFYLGARGQGTANVSNDAVISAGGGLNFGAEFGGTGTLNLNSGGTLRVGGTGGIIVGGGSGFLNANGGTLEITGATLTTAVPIALGDGTTSTVNTNGLNATLSGNLTGTGSLTKTGSGSLTLSGANDYSGTTSVNAGTLVVNGSLANTTVTLADGATLGGSGSIAGLTTIGSGATLAPGNSPGTITFSAGLTLDAGAILEFQLGTVSDLISVTGGTLTGPSSGTVTLNLSDAGGFTDGTYTLFDYTSATLSDFDTTDFTIGTSIAGYDYSFTLTGTALQLIAVTSAVPEPSTYAAILGLGALGFVAWRKRRRG
jgi:fibronectin-binding autotransporter adhesin